MFLAFLSFSLCGTSGDLQPPFILGDHGKVGSWKVKGAAQVFDYSIQLVQPIQFRRGSVWTNLEIPSENKWNVQFKVRISETNGGGFGFWFIDKYAESGQLFGGPSSFNGIALLFQVLSDRVGLNIGVNMVTNDGGHNVLLGDIEKPDSAFRFNLGGQITIRMEFNNDKLDVYASTDDRPEPKLLFSRQITVDISQNYMGMTAQSDRNTLLCELNSIEFEIDESQDFVIKKKPISHMNDNIPEKYKPEEFYRLRNPAFVQTTTEMMKMDNSAGMVTSESTISDIFNVVEEINKAAFDVATYSDLNKFITTRVANYSARWQRRTLRMIERAAETRNITGMALKYAEDLMKTFNQTLQENSKKTRNKVIILGEILEEESVASFEELEAGNRSSIAQKLTYIGLFELVLCIIYLTYNFWSNGYDV